MNPENPYAAPAVTAPPPVRYNHVEIIPAGHGKRFLNMVIDMIVIMILAIVLGVVYAVVSGGMPEEDGREEDLMINILFLGVMVSYNTIMEGAFGKTVGKFITGTKVVTATGEKPSFGKAFLRSLCRHIPFDAFSYLGSDARGWHDSITKTWVVTTR